MCALCPRTECFSYVSSLRNGDAAPTCSCCRGNLDRAIDILGNPDKNRRRLCDALSIDCKCLECGDDVAFVVGDELTGAVDDLLSQEKIGGVVADSIKRSSPNVFPNGRGRDSVFRI